MSDRYPDRKTNSESEHNRRRFLSLLGASSASISLAGCQILSSSDDSSDDTSTASETATTTRTSAGSTAMETGTDSEGQTDTATDTETETETETDTPAGDVVRQVSVGTQDCSGTVVESCDQPSALSSNITSDTTLGNNCNRIDVEGEIDVSDGATLTIESGTQLTFRQDGSLKISGASALVAEGTCNDPIVFTGDQETRGYWDGIYVTNSDQQRSSMINCMVEYAGSSAFFYGDVGACLTVTRGSRLNVDNCTFQESAGYGVNFGSDVQITAFDNVESTANADGAAYVYHSTAHFLQGNGSYAGNDRDIVFVDAVTDIGNGMDVQWDELDVPYRIDGEADMTGDGRLTIQAGSTLEFTQNSEMTVQDSAKLTARGVDAETEEVRNITFTGVQETRGYWNGLYFNEADQVPSTLQRCVVEYGGGSQFFYASVKANVAVANGSRVTIDQTTLRESGGYGFNLETDVNIDAFTYNEVTSNESGAGYVRDTVAHHVSETGTYTGNDDDRVIVNPSNGISEDDDVEWDAIDANYYVDESDVETEGGLTIEPGATVEFGQDTSIQAKHGGYLNAEGVDDAGNADQITFTGAQQTRGYWTGVYFDETDRVENHLANVAVEYAGASQFFYAEEPANIAVTNSSRARFSDCTIRGSGGYGFDFEGSTTIDEFSSNTVTSNERGAGYVSGSVAHTLSDTSTYTGNDEDRVTLQTDTDVGENDEVEWDAIDVPYFLRGDQMDIYGGVTIQPGATLRFDQGTSIRMTEGGFLNASGTSQNQITFTGDQSTAGYWNGLYFDETLSAENELFQCVVEDAGASQFFYAEEAANVAVTNGSDATIRRSTFRNGAGYGYTVTADSSVTASGNSFSNNGLGSVFSG